MYGLSEMVYAISVIGMGAIVLWFIWIWIRFIGSEIANALHLPGTYAARMDEVERKYTKELKEIEARMAAGSKAGSRHRQTTGRAN